MIRHQVEMPDTNDISKEAQYARVAYAMEATLIEYMEALDGDLDTEEMPRIIQHLSDRYE